MKKAVEPSGQWNPLVGRDGSWSRRVEEIWAWIRMIPFTIHRTWGATHLSLWLVACKKGSNIYQIGILITETLNTCIVIICVKPWEQPIKKKLMQWSFLFLSDLQVSMYFFPENKANFINQGHCTIYLCDKLLWNSSNIMKNKICIIGLE